MKEDPDKPRKMRTKSAEGEEESPPSPLTDVSLLPQENPNICVAKLTQGLFGHEKPGNVLEIKKFNFLVREKFVKNNLFCNVLEKSWNNKHKKIKTV